MPNVPNSKLWTLRLKRGNRTTLLFADPAQSLTSIKVALLSALRSAPMAVATGDGLPEEPSEVEIGKPVDLSDLERGWELVDPMEPTEGADVSLRSLGIKENYVLAYRFKTDENTENVDETMGEERGWDVDLPLPEDAYGDEEEGDFDSSPGLPS